MTTAEGSISHGTAGRINVERDKDGGVTLRLFQWSLRPTATLTREEAAKLIGSIEEALAPPRAPKTLKFPEPESHEDLA